MAEVEVSPQQKVTDDAMKLPGPERIKLALKLIRSVDELSEDSFPHD